MQKMNFTKLWRVIYWRRKISMPYPGMGHLEFMSLKSAIEDIREDFAIWALNMLAGTSRW